MSNEVELKCIVKSVHSDKKNRDYYVAKIEVAPDVYKDVFLTDVEVALLRAYNVLV